MEEQEGHCGMSKRGVTRPMCDSTKKHDDGQKDDSQCMDISRDMRLDMLRMHH